jgi:hypothetical protein
MVLLKPGYQATEIKKEIGYLKQLEALGIKTPRRYKKITFIDVSMPKSNTKRHGLIVQKIKGAWDIKLRQKGIVPLVGVLDNSNNQLVILGNDFNGVKV